MAAYCHRIFGFMIGVLEIKKMMPLGTERKNQKELDRRKARQDKTALKSS